MVISFVNDFAHLPADGSEHQPHVIDITAYDANTDDEEDAYDTSKPRKFRLWDAVATLLHTISPLQLRNFLDIDSYNREIKVELKAKNEEIRTVIWKKGMEILIGEFIDHPNSDMYEWDNVMRYKVNSDGSWEATYVSNGLCTTRDWSAVWNGDFVSDKHGRGQVFINGEDYIVVEYFVARRIMGGCPWEIDGYDVTLHTM